ncbi:hypothetical protein ALC62_09372, partial [Cyphomyrmex costatus]
IEKLDGENVFIFSIDRFSRPLILMGLPRRLAMFRRAVLKNPLKVDLQFIYIKLDVTYFNDFAKWKFRGWRLSQMLEKTFFKPSGAKSTPIKYTSG